MKNIFVIDETGSPGNNSESKTLKSDRITYLAVFVDKEIRQSLIIEIKQLLIKLSPKENPWKEFHFNEIVNRRKEYKNLKSEEVINIIQAFANILNKYSLPFFNQTITPRTLEENGLKNNMNKSLDEIALDFLSSRIKDFIVKNNLGKSIDFSIDEGLKKSGQKLEMPILREVVDDNNLYFKKSEDDVLIQVADFFAYALNRNQMVMIKDKSTEFDIILLSILNSVFYGNQSSGSKSDLITKVQFNKEDYDKRQIEYFKKMGVYEYWKKVNP
jgi:hypothetical protein